LGIDNNLDLMGVQSHISEEDMLNRFKEVKEAIPKI